MSLVPQLGFPELMVLGVLALLVIGPKDLPKFLHSAGQAFGKMRRMADEFRAGLQQVAREAEIEEMRKEIDGLKEASGAKDVEDTFRDIQREANQPLSVAEHRNAEDDIDSALDHHGDYECDGGGDEPDDPPAPETKSSHG